MVKPVVPAPGTPPATSIEEAQVSGGRVFMDPLHSLHKDLLGQLNARCCDMMATKRDTWQAATPCLPRAESPKAESYGKCVDKTMSSGDKCTWKQVGLCLRCCDQGGQRLNRDLKDEEEGTKQRSGGRALQAGEQHTQRQTWNWESEIHDLLAGLGPGRGFPDRTSLAHPS